jgi:N-alpha-acetyltransferase 38, NatC auxiliary subunit
MEKSQAEDYLTSLLNKTLRVTTTDTRMFLGQFKCTDSVRVSTSLRASPPPFPNPFTRSRFPPSLSRLKLFLARADALQDRNIILSQTFEYRLPPAPKHMAGEEETITMDMTSRYMGLVVVPGEYIERIEVEVEEFESQMKGKKGVAVAGGKGEGEKEEV